MASPHYALVFSSQAAYKQIVRKRLGFLKLPYMSRPKQYCKFSKGGPGFNPCMLKRLIQQVQQRSSKRILQLM